MNKFEDLNLNINLIKGLQEQNITSPTKVQSLTIEDILNNKDLLVSAQTGSGKTLAYLLPMFEKIDTSKRETQVLVLAPTHELVMQITQQAKDLAQNSGVDVTSFSIIGEVNIQKQIKNIKAIKPHIVVGTCGRVLDLIKQKKLKAHTIKTIILDEVDSLLSGKNEEVIENIIKTTLRDRQLLGFSASLNENTISVCDYLMKDMKVVKANENLVMNSNISHMYLYGDKREKFTLLRKALASANPTRSIVFVNDEESIEIINDKLNYHNYKSVCISGKMTKEDRKNALSAFRSGKALVLVSSDLSARGLDIVEVSHVFNLDFPPSKNEYVHRCGRSARGNRKGTAISIITNQNLNTIRDYRRDFKVDMKAIELKNGKFIEIDFDKMKKEAKKKSAENNIRVEDKNSTKKSTTSTSKGKKVDKYAHKKTEQNSKKN